MKIKVQVAFADPPFLRFLHNHCHVKCIINLIIPHLSAETLLSILYMYISNLSPLYYDLQVRFGQALQVPAPRLVFAWEKITT